MAVRLTAAKRHFLMSFISPVRDFVSVAPSRYSGVRNDRMLRVDQGMSRPIYNIVVRYGIVAVVDDDFSARSKL